MAYILLHLFSEDNNNNLKNSENNLVNYCVGLLTAVCRYISVVVTSRRGIIILPIVQAEQQGSRELSCAIIVATSHKWLFKLK